MTDIWRNKTDTPKTRSPIIPLQKHKTIHQKLFKSNYIPDAKSM